MRYQGLAVLEEEEYKTPSTRVGTYRPPYLILNHSGGLVIEHQLRGPYSNVSITNTCLLRRINANIKEDGGGCGSRKSKRHRGISTKSKDIQNLTIFVWKTSFTVVFDIYDP
jgi:hypothetical protein